MIKNIGLKNINSICFLNSLIQTLLSCKTFVNTIKNNKDSYMRENNIIGIIFFNIILKIENNISITNDNEILSIKMGLTGENCTHETFINLINILKIEKIFNMGYENNIYCTKCEKITQQFINNAITYELFHEQEKKKNFSKTINSELEYLTDYTCDFCKKNNIHLKQTNLIEANSIFVVMFNQYNEKTIHLYENELILLNNKYKLVAKINHKGSLNNGHYWMDRYTDSGIYMINDEYIKKIEDDNKNNIYTYMLFYEK